MLRKLMLLALSALLMLAGLPACLADEFAVENVLPDEPLETDGEFIHVVAEYHAQSGLTRYTATLVNDPVFADGSPITAKDLIFSLYVLLDPGYESETPLTALPIPGLRSYRMQISEDRLSAAIRAMDDISAAGPAHVRSESDGWTEAQQSAYWAAREAYDAACEAEYPACAQAIVDSCARMLADNPNGAFGYTAGEIAANEGLRVAYAMLQWGYATSVDNVLVGKRSRTSWLLSSDQPSLDDFVHELKLAYGDDLGACWAIESSGNSAPALTDVESAYLQSCFSGECDGVISVSGIRTIDDATVEIDLEGVNMHEAGTLFGQPVLSLDALGDAALWSPESGLYGHPFGDVSAVDAAGFDGPALLDASDEIVF